MSTGTTTDSALSAGGDLGDPIGGPTASSWREQALTRIAELEDLAYAFREDRIERDIIAARIHRHLRTAREAAGGHAGPEVRNGHHRPKRRRWSAFRALIAGSPLERTASNIDAAEADLLQLAPPAFLRGQLPSLVAHVRGHLPIEDLRRQTVEDIWVRSATQPLAPEDQTAIIAAARAASSAARREVVQLRSFRNVLYFATALLTAAAIGLLALGINSPSAIPLCFTPTGSVVCPTSVADTTGSGGEPTAAEHDRLVRDTASGEDITVVALVGLVGAALAAAFALRRTRGTTTPYSLPVALAVLKLPSGVITAILGIVLMRGEFVPGLSDLDSPAQILAWAVLFGYAQQVFTRLVDDRAHQVLDQTGGRPQSTDVLTGARVTRHHDVASNGSVRGVPEGTESPSDPPDPSSAARERHEPEPGSTVKG